MDRKNARVLKNDRNKSRLKPIHNKPRPVRPRPVKPKPIPLPHQPVEPVLPNLPEINSNHGWWLNIDQSQLNQMCSPDGSVQFNMTTGECN